MLASSVSVNVLTGINVWKDKTVIQNKIDNFTSTCKNTDRDIHEYCGQWNKMLALEAEHAFKIFDNGFSSRKKRSWGWGAAKGIAIVAPHVITAGVMTYQQIEMNNLSNDLINAQNKLKKATDIVTKISNEATTMSNEKIIEVTKIQNKIAIQNQIHSKAQQISDTIALITTGRN